MGERWNPSSSTNQILSKKENRPPTVFVLGGRIQHLSQNYYECFVLRRQIVIEDGAVWCLYASEGGGTTSSSNSSIGNIFLTSSRRWLTGPIIDTIRPWPDESTWSPLPRLELSRSSNQNRNCCLSPLRRLSVIVTRIQASGDLLHQYAQRFKKSFLACLLSRPLSTTFSKAFSGHSKSWCFVVSQRSQ